MEAGAIPLRRTGADRPRRQAAVGHERRLRVADERIVVGRRVVGGVGVADARRGRDGGGVAQARGPRAHGAAHRVGDGAADREVDGVVDVAGSAGGAGAAAGARARPGRAGQSGRQHVDHVRAGGAVGARVAGHDRVGDGLPGGGGVAPVRLRYRQLRRDGVVVDDRGRPRAVADRGVDRRREHDRERLGRLIGKVAEHGDVHGL